MLSRRFGSKVGRRGAFLLLFGVVYLVMGFGLTFMPGIETRLTGMNWLHIALAFLPFNPIFIFTVLWALCGAAATTAAFYVRPRDWFGYSALVLAPLIWGSLFLVGVFFGEPFFNLLSTLVYWLFGTTPIIVSGMQGDNDRDHREVII